MDIHKAFKSLKRFRFTFIGVSIVAFALLAAAPTSNAPPEITHYQSQAKILLTPPSGNVNAFGGRGGMGTDLSQSWFADPTILQELMRSEDLLKRVVLQSESKVPWEQIRNLIEIEPLSQSPYGVKLFLLTVMSKDPTEAQKISRLITEEFSAYVQEISAREFASTRKFIEELVVEAEQRRLQAEENLMAVREKYLGSPNDTEIQSQQMNLESQRRELAQKVPSLQAELSALNAFLDGQATSPPWTILSRSESSLTTLESRIAENQLKLEQAREVYTEENQNVVSARERLGRAQELYQRGLRDHATSLRNSKSLELQQLVSREQGLSQQLNALLASQMTPEDRRASQKLERELSVWEENHLSLTQQLYQARVVEQSSRRQGSVTVLEQPLPGSPVMPEGFEMAAPGPNRAKKLAMAIPFCLILGAAAALLRDYLSTTMKLRPRIEEILEVPVIAVIPAAPSALTVDWERFKRPVLDSLEQDLARARNGSKANGRHSGSNGHANGQANTNGHGEKSTPLATSAVDEFRPDK